MSSETNQSKSGFRWKWLFYFIAVIAVVAAGKFLPVQELLKTLLDWIGNLGGWAPVLFIAIYIIAAVLFIPGSLLTLGAGAVFGLTWGFVYASIASVSGAVSAFLIGRHLAREIVARKIKGNARFEAIDKAVASEGWKIVLLTRLSPIFPYSLLNYAFGVTRIQFGHFLLASWIGMMPGTVLYVYLGSLAKVATGERSRSTGEWVLYGVGLVATMAVTIYVTRIARRALALKIES